MGYQMIYQSDRETLSDGKRLRRQTMIAVCFFVFALAVRVIWEPGSLILRELLLPGELTATEAAFTQLVYDLQHGRELAATLEVFCRQVINGGT